MKAYPRIYALATKKDGKVIEFGNWNNDVWKWEVQLRRNIFDLELDQWKAFEACIGSQKIRKSVSDMIAMLDSLGNALLIYNPRTTNRAADLKAKQENSDFEGQTSPRGNYQIYAD
ncbi:hypothetical protein Dsin_022700 [Dipteronia sinensis]|uniref:Uncharacterized protein n=1 Tax=Dipteronia sinensis TaxID=43782 RepID=A0AAE0E005_9ROSI|nr:hypothetical protein Dsin_022700 [Dipteronia sinensis]